MRIAISGKGTFAAKNLLKRYKLTWVREKRAWVGDVDRLTVSIIRTSVMPYQKFLTLTFEDKKEEEEFYGWPRWECGKCHNIIRKAECKFISASSYKCPFCGQISRLLED